VVVEDRVWRRTRSAGIPEAFRPSRVASGEGHRPPQPALVLLRAL